MRSSLILLLISLLVVGTASTPDVAVASDAAHTCPCTAERTSCCPNDPAPSSCSASTGSTLCDCNAMPTPASTPAAGQTAPESKRAVSIHDVVAPTIDTAAVAFAADVRLRATPRPPTPADHGVWRN